MQIKVSEIRQEKNAKYQAGEGEGSLVIFLYLEEGHIAQRSKTTSLVG